MELTAIYKRVIGLDVHQAKISACAVAEQADGKVAVESREFGGFKRDSGGGDLCAPTPNRPRRFGLTHRWASASKYH